MPETPESADMTLESATPVFGNMTRSQLDAAYNNTEAVTDSHQQMENWVAHSTRLRRAGNAVLDLEYGQQPANRCDVFKAGAPGQGLFIFIHGGYWQRNSKDMFAFVSAGLVARNINVATIGYTLAPDASLSEIVAEVSAAVDMLVARHQELGFDPENVHVGGWSAGGHLAAILAEHPNVKGVAPISGIFDLQPISRCYLDEKLKLTSDEITALSPMNRKVPAEKHLALFAGALELPELRRQSEDYATRLNRCGNHVMHHLVPGRNHYSILDELRDDDGIITNALTQLISG